jgi:hypothetical protein
MQPDDCLAHTRRTSGVNASVASAGSRSLWATRQLGTLATVDPVIFTFGNQHDGYSHPESGSGHSAEH